MSEQKIDDVPDGWEVFWDICDFEQWAVRPIGERRFYYTAHYPTREQAIQHARAALKAEEGM